MDYTRWLIRAKGWAQHPPPVWKVILVLCVIAACLAVAAFEHLWGWPDWLKVNKIKI